MSSHESIELSLLCVEGAAASNEVWSLGGVIQVTGNVGHGWMGGKYATSSRHGSGWMDGTETIGKSSHWFDLTATRKKKGGDAWVLSVLGFFCSQSHMSIRGQQREQPPCCGCSCMSWSCGLA